VERIYGWGHAFMSIPRVFVLSFINFAASVRAIRIFVASKFSGNSIAWDKTMHRFPSDEWLGQEKRRLGEILLSWEAVSPPALERALIDQRLNGGMLGDLLICHGSIDEETLAEAIATQNHMQRAEINLEMVREYIDLFDEEIMDRLHVLPFGISKEGEVMLAVAKPLAPGEADWMRARLAKPIRQQIVAESRIREIIALLVDQPHWIVPVPSVPRVHELLIQKKLLTKKGLRAVLQDYDVARHGTIGQYLVARDAITQVTLNEMVNLRSALIGARREQLQKEMAVA
jgi:adsorption protein B